MTGCPTRNRKGADRRAYYFRSRLPVPTRLPSNFQRGTFCTYSGTCRTKISQNVKFPTLIWRAIAPKLLVLGGKISTAARPNQGLLWCKVTRAYPSLGRSCGFWEKVITDWAYSGDNAKGLAAISV